MRQQALDEIAHATHHARRLGAGMAESERHEALLCSLIIVLGELVEGVEQIAAYAEALVEWQKGDDVRQLERVFEAYMERTHMERQSRAVSDGDD